MPKAIHASLQALCMIFGYPSTERPAALNIEKFQAVQCSEIQTQLGIEINSRKLEITLPTQKFNQIHKLLTGTWHTSRRQFRPLEAAQLLGLLRHAVAVSWWGKYTFMALQAALGMAIRNESLRQMRSQVAVGPLPKLSQYKHTWQQIVVTALRQPDMEWTSTRAGLRKAFKVDWHLMGKAAMTTDLHQELEFLRYLFSDNKCRHWKIPLAQVVPWVSHFTVYANASLSGLGAACKELQFFMQLHIPLCIQRRTLLHMSSAEARNNPLFVPINDLELAAAIFSYAAAKCAILSDPPSIASKRPVLQLFSDNVSALAHLRKGTARSHRSRSLLRNYCCLAKGATLSMNSAHIAGVKILLADALSRNTTAFKLKPLIILDLILNAHTQMRGAKLFLPLHRLASLIWRALYSADLPGRPTQTMLQLMQPDASILGTFVLPEVWVSQTSTPFHPQDAATSS